MAELFTEEQLEAFDELERRGALKGEDQEVVGELRSRAKTSKTHFKNQAIAKRFGAKSAREVKRKDVRGGSIIRLDEGRSFQPDPVKVKRGGGLIPEFETEIKQDRVDLERRVSFDPDSEVRIGDPETKGEVFGAPINTRAALEVVSETGRNLAGSLASITDLAVIPASEVSQLFGGPAIPTVRNFLLSPEEREEFGSGQVGPLKNELVRDLVIGSPVDIKVGKLMAPALKPIGRFLAKKVPTIRKLLGETLEQFVQREGGKVTDDIAKKAKESGFPLQGEDAKALLRSLREEKASIAAGQGGLKRSREAVAAKVAVEVEGEAGEAAAKKRLTRGTVPFDAEGNPAKLVPPETAATATKGLGGTVEREVAEGLLEEPAKLARGRKALENLPEEPPKFTVAKQQTKLTSADIEQQKVRAAIAKEFEEEALARGVKPQEIPKIKERAAKLDPDVVAQKKSGFTTEEAWALEQGAMDDAADIIKLMKVGDDAGMDEAILRAIDKEPAVGAATSEAARTLRLKQEVGIGKDAAERNLNKLIKAIGGKKELVKMLRERIKTLDLDDPQIVGQFLREITTASNAEKLHEAWMMGILSGAQTHVVNVTSNTLEMGLRGLYEKALAAGVDITKVGVKRTAKAVGGKLGIKRAANLDTVRKNFFGEPAAFFVGVQSSLKNAARVAGKSFKTEVSSFGGTKLEEAGTAAIKGKLGRFVRIPGRALVAMDDFFKHLGYNGQIQSEAYKQAAKEMAGKKFASPMAKLRATVKRQGQIVANPSKHMIKGAKQFATDATFQTKLKGFGSAIQGLRNAWEPMKYVIPFVRTPFNLAKRGLMDFTPMKFLEIGGRSKAGRFIATKFKKKFGEKISPIAADELALEWGRATMATLATAGAWTYVSEGKISGHGPKSAKERAAKFSEGWKPYTFKFRGKYYPYKRLEPIGTALGVMADFFELKESFHPDDIAAALSQSVARNITSATYAKGLSDFFDMISDPERYGDNYFQRFAGSLVPTFLRQVTRGLDPTLRDPQNIGQRIRSGIPLLNEGVLPRFDMWGNDVVLNQDTYGDENPDGTFKKMVNILNPFQASEGSTDPATKEIMRIWRATDDNGVLPPSTRRTGKFKDISDEQWSKYIKGKHGEMRAFVAKKLSRKGWEKKSDKNKARLIKREFSKIKREWAADLSEGKI